MSKADRHKKRAKHKAAWANAVQLAPVPRLKARGRARMAEIRADPEAQAVVVAARMARGAPDADAARDPLQGDDMGRCIIALTGQDERRAITEAWAAMSAAWHNYCTRILGRSTGPQGAAIAIIPERMQADPSFRIDPRTADERDAAAKKAWAAWHGRISILPTPMHRWALRGALQGFIGDESLWRDREPTSNGRLAVAALRMLT